MNEQKIETLPWKELLFILSEDYEGDEAACEPARQELFRRLADRDTLKAELEQWVKNDNQKTHEINVLVSENRRLIQQLEEAKAEIARLDTVAAETRRKTLEEMAKFFDDSGNHTARNCCLMAIKPTPETKG